ncbi:FIST signal transduction protein [Aliikangiella coralliicola]|uniref:Histidine kinase n=1 Tax=Aliikangiella coralliicola TaxID=2592383 RepID=A0A545UH21_9GAMM|nr:FIST N-terminal domain-containing protein [Aliikangiella coralliicola]TQV88766.1 hypothetical protein FLL46_04335 [Aliikangiella coralliicola]
MQVSQFHFRDQQWFPQLPKSDYAGLLLTFGDRALIQNSEFSQQLRSAFPIAEIIGCTTSGEILATEVYDDTFVVTAITFDKTQVEVLDGNVADFQRSFDAGLALADALLKENLKYVLLLSDGQLVNGTELVDGVIQALPKNVLVTGGMAGDSDRFQETVVWHNESVESGKIVLCGFYGDSIRVGHGTLGGWDTFGPQRTITKSRGNILYELDGQPALDLYKSYLGEFSQQLPSSALRFPLSLQLPGESESVVRTILNIDEKEKCMIFAGDMPEGASAKLMKANFETLIDGANGAAKDAVASLKSDSAKIALLISCVGRRLVLSQRVYEELEAVADVVGEDCPFCGFYSYGEISPLVEHAQCRLHNQTMTITTISEVLDA